MEETIKLSNTLYISKRGRLAIRTFLGIMTMPEYLIIEMLEDIDSLKKKIMKNKTYTTKIVKVIKPKKVKKKTK